MIIDDGQVMIWSAAEQCFVPGNVGSISGGLTAPAGTGFVVHTGGGGSIDRTLQDPVAGFVISNPDGVAGDPTFTLTDDLAGLEAVTGTGFAKRTAINTWSVAGIVAGDLPGSFSGFANPTAQVGLAAINGAATTAMRSDAAPALSQAIAPTWTERHIFSKVGVLSAPPVSLIGAWITGGTSTTTKPQFLIEPTGATSSAWSTAGTGFGVNAASGFAGNLIDAQLAGSSRFSVTSSAVVNIKPGNRSYTIDADDPAGVMRFGRSDVAGSYLTLLASTSYVRFGTAGASNILFEHIGGGIIFTPAADGGAGLVQFGRRISDSHPAVGASVEFWPVTGQSTPVLATVPPGGGGTYRFKVMLAGDTFIPLTDTSTNVIGTTLTLGHNTSGTAAAGLGTGLQFNLQSSTTADQNAGRIAALWTTATHASRTADLVFYTVNNAAAQAEAMRITGNRQVRVIGAATIALADAASPGINFRNATTGIATTMEWWAGTGGVPGMPYDLGAYFSSHGGFYSGREVVISNKRSSILGIIQGVSALPDGSEPSMIAVSPDVNGPSIAVEAHGAMGAGFENQSILAGYDLDSPNGGGAGSYSPQGYGSKRFAISSRGEMFWGPLINDSAANATARLTWNLDDEITISRKFRVLNSDGTAELVIDGKSDSTSRIVFKSSSGGERWTLNQLNTIGGANPWLSLTTPAGPNALVLDGATGNIGVGQDPDGNKLTVNGNVLIVGNGYVGGHWLPTLTDTSDLGSSIKLWRKGWLSELDTILFSQNTQTLVGGWLVLTKNEGAIPVGQDVGTGDTTIDFGQFMTLNDFVVFRSSLQVEYVQVGTLSSGTRYNVTRNLDGSGANAWPAGSVYRVDGNTGNGRIELNANATPRISLLRQGATYNAQTEMVRIGDLNGEWGAAASETYGFAVGQYNVASKSSLRIDDTGIHFYNVATKRIQLLADGSGFLANSLIAWDTAGNVTITGNATIAGWTVNSVYFAKDTGTNATSSGMAPADFPFFAGSTYANRATAVFRVTPAGALTATSATITGNITATSGLIGAWTIGATRISSTNVFIDQAGQYISMGTTPPTSYGSNVGIFLEGANSGRLSLYKDANNFLQWDNAKLIWKGANTSLDASGNLTVTGGTIGGWTIASTTITSTGVTVASGATAYLAFGTTPPTSPTAGTGNYSDKTGLFGVQANKQTFALSASAGTLKLGSDLSGVATTSMVMAGTAITYNSESLAASAILLGDNSANQANVLLGSGSLKLRRGTTDFITLSTTDAQFTNLIKMTGASAAIAIGTTPPTSASAGTGIWLDRTGLYGLASNVVQAKFDATTGIISAGAGAVTLNSTGIEFGAGTGSANIAKWKDGADITGSVYSFYQSGTTTSNLILRSSGKNSGSSNSWVWLTARNYEGGINETNMIVGMTGVGASPASTGYAYLYSSGGTFKGFTVGTDDDAGAMLDVRGDTTISGKLAVGLTTASAGIHISRSYVDQLNTSLRMAGNIPGISWDVSGGGSNRNFAALANYSNAGYWELLYSTTAGGNPASVAVQVNAASGAVRFNQYTTGTATFDGSGNITSTSDARLKSQVRVFDYGIERLMKIKPAIVYRWNQLSGLDPRDENVGWLAQEMLDVIPEAVGNKDNVREGRGFYSFSDRPILATAINCLQIHERRLQDHESELERLRSLVVSQQAEIEALKQARA